MWHSYRIYFISSLFSLLLGLCLILATRGVAPFDSTLLAPMQRQFYDLEIRLLPKQSPLTTPRIILIDIDEQTMSNEGRWLWRREKIADFIETLALYKPKLIALNEVFDHIESNPIDELENKLSELKQPLPPTIAALRDGMDGDLILSKTIAAYGIILGFSFHDQKAENQLLNKGLNLPDTTLITGWQALGYSANLSRYQRASAGEGHIATQVDSDGLLRTFPLLMQYNQSLYPAFALTIAQHYWQAPDYAPRLGQHNGQVIYTGIQVGTHVIPSDAFGQILIPYRTDLSAIQRLSAQHIVAEDPYPELENAIVIIGSSSSLVSNKKSTPVKADMAEFEIQALALHGLLHPHTLWYQPIWDYQWITIELTLFTLLVLWLYPFCRPHALLAWGLSLALLTVLIHYALHEVWQAYVSPAPTLLFIFSSTLSFLIAGLFYESRSRAQLQYRFGQYVPVEHIQKMLEQPDTINLDGERREMTVLFADLHDFTQMSEQMGTQTLKQFLNRYLTYATETIFQHRGTIDKYIGDLIMAFWGAPLVQAQHAEQAVLAALALQQRITTHQAEFKALGAAEVKLGIGINTGEMNVGEMGSDYRRAYTVLGDAVNIAARIEPLTRFYQVGVLVTEATKQQCPTLYFRTIDKVQVKGKQAHLMLYQPIAPHAALTTEQLLHYQRYEQAVAACYAKRWDEALALLNELIQANPDDYMVQLYQQRVKNCTQNPMPYWTGVQAHLQKH